MMCLTLYLLLHGWYCIEVLFSHYKSIKSVIHKKCFIGERGILVAKSGKWQDETGEKKNLLFKIPEILFYNLLFRFS